MQVAVAIEGVTLSDPFTIRVSRIPCIGEQIYHPQNGIMRVKQVIHPSDPQEYAGLLFAEQEPTLDSHEQLLANTFGL